MIISVRKFLLRLSVMRLWGTLRKVSSGSNKSSILFLASDHFLDHIFVLNAAVYASQESLLRSTYFKCYPSFCRNAATNCDTIDKSALDNCACLFSNSKDYENLSHA